MFRFVLCSICGEDAPGKVCIECEMPICHYCDGFGHDCEA